MVPFDEAPVSPRLRILAFVSVAFFLIDVFVLNLYLLSVGGGLALLIGAVLTSFSRRDPGRIVLVRASIPIVMMAASIAGIVGQNRLAQYRAEQLVDAVNRHASERGDYPEELEALIPEYLSSVPVAKYTLTMNQFRYWKRDHHAYLMWTELPPFGRPGYDFETQRWTYVD